MYLFCKLLPPMPIPKVSDTSSLYATVPNTIVMVRNKGPNFTMDEDIALTRAWVKATLDPRIGTNQTSRQFWGKVFDFFKEIYESSSEKPTIKESRTVGTVQNRFKRVISSECKTMDTIMKNNPRGTGQNEEMYAATCAKIYLDQEKKAFRFADCFVYLKDVPTFAMGSGQEAVAALPDELQELFAGVDAATATANAHVEHGTAVDTVNLRLERPIGVKAAKKGIKRSSGWTRK